MNREDFERWLVERVVVYGGIAKDTFDVQTPLQDLGFISVYALTLCGDIEDEFGFDIDPAIVWDHPTIHALSAVLVERAQESASIL